MEHLYASNKGSEEFSSIQFWTGIASVSKGMA